MPFALADQPRFHLVETSALNMIVGRALGRAGFIGGEIAVSFSR